MDPDAALEAIREDVRSILTFMEFDANDEDRALGSDFAECAESLADKVEALDEWIVKGGFLPKAWNEP